jgi:hypothetical protein
MIFALHILKYVKYEILKYDLVHQICRMTIVVDR